MWHRKEKRGKGRNDLNRRHPLTHRDGVTTRAAGDTSVTEAPARNYLIAFNVVQVYDIVIIPFDFRK